MGSRRAPPRRPRPAASAASVPPEPSEPSASAPAPSAPVSAPASAPAPSASAPSAPAPSAPAPSASAPSASAPSASAPSASGPPASAAPGPKLSQRALKRLRGWEPVVQPPAGAEPLPRGAAREPVWPDSGAGVTFIPASDGGVHTRRGAATLAATAPPTSFLVFTRDPLSKVARARQQGVHVLASVLPGEDPRSVLRAQRSACETPSSSRHKTEDGSEDNSSEEDEHQKQEEQEEAKGIVQRERRAVPRLSAAQAMLPPPYRRNRRLRKKLHITEETPVFAAHSALREAVPRHFHSAPFSTEEDVLRSIIDWRDDAALLCARLMWDFAPDVLLARTLRIDTGTTECDN